MKIYKLFAFTLIALTPIFAFAGDHKAMKEKTYLEWVRFELLNNTKRAALEKYLGDTVIPQLNENGCSPIGVFRPKYGAHGNEVYMLVPHKNIESFQNVWSKVDSPDDTLQEPLYQRFESTLMESFAYMPHVEIPEHIEGKAGRIYELRIYEAHNRKASTLKVEMFNEGGEIEVFRKTGLYPVFFGKTIAGPLMPNLIYMLGFESITERDANWKNFINSDEWAAIKDLPRYKDTVSGITDIIYVPSRVSQI